MTRWLVAAFLLTVVVSACGRKPAYRPPPPPEPEVTAPPEEKFGGQKVTDTGAIRFICQGAGKHEEEEIEINRCPGCGLENYFVQHEGAFWCYKCSKQLAMEALKCDKCGTAAKKPKIKHK
jgi:predicted small lipoprotein YifL